MFDSRFLAYPVQAVVDDATLVNTTPVGENVGMLLELPDDTGCRLAVDFIVQSPTWKDTFSGLQPSSMASKLGQAMSVELAQKLVPCLLHAHNEHYHQRQYHRHPSSERQFVPYFVDSHPPVQSRPRYQVERRMDNHRAQNLPEPSW